MRINKSFRKFKWIVYTSILLSLFLFTYQVAAIENEEPASKEKSEDQTITHEEIIALTDKFMEQLVQEVDEDYRVVHFDTKAALEASFDHIANREVIAEYVDFYYEETADGLYILPTETPPWFIKENDYNVIQLNKDQVEVVQENQTDLYGAYTITYEFSFDDDDWKITKIKMN